MAEIFVVRHPGNILGPATIRDKQVIEKWKTGDYIKVTVTRPRNGQFHRKFMAMVNFVFDNQDRYQTLEDLLVEFKLRAGHYQEHITAKGKLIYIPKSISFASMDEDDFAEFYSRCIDIALKYFMTGSTRQEIEDKVEDLILGFG